MRRVLFNRIKGELLANHSDVFAQRQDALGKLGLSIEQKMTACLQMLAYGGSADRNDEYVRIAESTTLKYLQAFCDAIIASFGSFYLRQPTPEDLRYILSLHSARGWPGKLGSLDCMHWTWKNCPIAWAGMYQLGTCFILFYFYFYFCLLIFFFFRFSFFIFNFYNDRQRRKAHHSPRSGR